MDAFVMMINYDGRRFRVAKNSETGETGTGTVFHYHQSGTLVWAEYSGGEIAKGHLIGSVDTRGHLDIRYHHVNRAGVIMTGICSSTPETLADGRICLYEKWQWTSGDHSAGESVLEEF